MFQQKHLDLYILIVYFYVVSTSSVPKIRCRSERPCFIRSYTDRFTTDVSPCSKSCMDFRISSRRQRPSLESLACSMNMGAYSAPETVTCPVSPLLVSVSVTAAVRLVYGSNWLEIRLPRQQHRQPVRPSGSVRSSIGCGTCAEACPKNAIVI